MTVLIFGAGFLGHKLASVIPDARLISQDISDRNFMTTLLRYHEPRAVINAAGKTGLPNVDWCEANKTITMRSNTIGALVLADACAELDIHLTHLSSGCIFYGQSPDPKGWHETDHANPSAFYSRSKYASDIVLSDLDNVAVVRLRMPIDSIPGPRNLITKLAGYPKIIDVENSVTVIDDLVRAVQAIVEQQATGVFHAVNDGAMRHRDLIALYEQLVDPTHTNEWISSDKLLSLGLISKGRSNCILQNTRLSALGVEMRPVSTALRACMEQYAKRFKAA
jgi:dTDP-4-dehydrorhamnose reductase